MGIQQSRTAAELGVALAFAMAAGWATGSLPPAALLPSPDGEPWRLVHTLAP